MNEIKALNERDFRKLIRAFFSLKISDGNVQHYHGPGEHGVDTLATISELNDPLKKGQILYIQIKAGNISLHDWRTDIQGQMIEAYNSTIMPFGTSKDNSRRLLLIISGECQPEVYNAITNWNKQQRIPVELFDILGIISLFEKYNMKKSDFKDLFELSKLLEL